MFDLNNINTSYLLISPEKKNNYPIDNKFSCDKLLNILYAKDYTILQINSYHKNLYENSFIAISPDDNSNVLREDSLYIMNEFDLDSVYVKYRNESVVNVLNDGSEIPMSVTIYDNDTNIKTYLYNGMSFSLKEEKRYFFPNRKEDLKNGMIVEYFNSSKWIEKKINNVDVEYENMFKLLIKYKKLRIS
jgi:hypothetical protein